MNTYDLRRRRYLGPTSMDTEMAFLMTNMAGLPAGAQVPALVLDPFVGTGSCLIPAAHRGALVLGCDIDARVIKMGERGVVRVVKWCGAHPEFLAPPSNTSTPPCCHCHFPPLHPTAPLQASGTRRGRR